MERGHVGTLGITGVHFPHIDLALLVAQRNDLLPWIETEAHKPNLTFIVLEFGNDGAGGIARLQLLETLMQLSRLPAHDGILTRFGEHKVTEPLHTVHIVSMYIARGEVREMFGDCGKGESRFLLAECVGQLNLVLKLLCVEAPQLKGMIHAGADNTIATHIEIYG